jgi:hypothetical protein
MERIENMLRGCLASWWVIGCVACAGCGDAGQPATRESGSSPHAAAAPQEKSEPSAEEKMLAHFAAPQEATGDAPALGPDVDLDVLQFAATDKWVRKQPRSGFVLAEFSLPKAEGDERDGRLTVSTAGGSIGDNVDRWRKQFGGKPQKESKDEVELAGVTVTVVDFSGKFNDQAGMMGPSVEREGYRMLGAIIPVKGTLYFVKSYGPEKTMAANADTFRAFLNTLKIK